MTELTFPSSPSNNDIYEFAGKRWQFNDVGWSLVSGPDTGVQIGDIIATLDASPQTGFIELAGATITDGALDYPGVASRYPWMVSGDNLVTPDFRGRVLRSWDHGAGVDPGAASRTARAGDSQTGDYPGTYQADGAPNITGTYSLNRSGSDGSSGAFSSTGGVGMNAAAAGSAAEARIDFYASNSNAKYGSAADIRMLNINVMFQMRVL